jgi:hypothetical protein
VAVRSRFVFDEARAAGDPPMTDPDDEIRKLSAAIKAYFQAHVEKRYKSVGYLLVAHGGGLVSCVTFIRDKASTPGVQIFASLFAYGFLSAIVAYVFTALWAQEVRRYLIYATKNRLFKIALTMSFIFMLISVALLISAVALIARNLGAF